MNEQAKEILTSVKVVLQGEIDLAEKMMADFLERFGGDPVYQLEWAQYVYQAVGRRVVAQKVQDYIQMFEEGRLGIDDLTVGLDEMADQAIGATFNKRTLPTMDLMRAAIAEAWHRLRKDTLRRKFAQLDTVL